MPEVSNPGLITFQASAVRQDGGWNHCIIALPPGASQDAMDAAITQWQAMRDTALPALLAAPVAPQGAESTPGAAYTAPAPVAPLDALVTTKKYAGLGKTWRDVISADPDYVDFLLSKQHPQAVAAWNAWLAETTPPAPDAGPVLAGQPVDDNEFDLFG